MTMMMRLRLPLSLTLCLLTTHYSTSAWIPSFKTALKTSCNSRSRCFMTATEGTDKQNQNQNQKQQQNDNNNNNINSNNNILEDSPGHINRDLAERIWNWEQEHRNEQKLPKLEYSVRSGLRLVNEIARDMMLRLERGSSSSSSTEQKKKKQDDNDVYSDLVQEGLSALLDAMSHYPRDDSPGFERYARQHIRNQMAQGLSREYYSYASAIRLPRSVRNVIQQARHVMNTITQEQRGQAATLTQVANRMNIPLERLQDYMHLAQRTVSMESTVEIIHPMLEPDSGPAYQDQDEWELQQGLLLDNGRSVLQDELVEDYIDGMEQREGDDDSWIQEQEQVAGPLQDVIPDNDEPSPDDQALAEMIRSDMSAFLTLTLEPQEVRVIRLAFGLDSGVLLKTLSVEQVAQEVGMEEEDVSKMLAGALRKLRASYENRYIEPYLEDEDEHPVDSV